MDKRCQNCGTTNPESANTCAQCGTTLSSAPQAGNTQTPPPRPDNQLTKAILVTLFCCLPFGIAAIVYAAGVDGAYNSGDYELANTKAENAKKYITISFWLGLLISLPLTLGRIYSSY